ncbi:MAG TPA: phosphate acyltransferase PlsX [Verrucomicrobiae bacterium]|nr:phosphate acyltransferase PlsX [Verrucomicrobiae bacterium]
MRIAVDVMGGDHGSAVVISGVKQALESDRAIQKIFLVGNETEIQRGRQQFQLSDARAEVVHASEVLTMDDKPLEGIRRKKDSSMVRAIELVYEGKADAVISPGNTGALVAGSMKLRRLEGVKRPAIAVRMPSKTRDFVLLDAGANDVCEPLHLAQFAVMGNIYAQKILGLSKPRVGVLSNGSEETKGNDLTRGAARLCSQLDLNFIGYVEGFDLFDDAVDVVVTDGFTGNVVLKTAESLSRAMMHLLKTELKANPVRLLGAKLSQGAFMQLKKRVDPEVYGGAVLLGLNGIVIKAHGSSRERAITNAIRVATEEISHGVNQTISQEITRANERLGT